MSLTYGEMFAGYGGLGLGVQSVLGGEMKWCAEFDKAPSEILAHHWPDVPNLGDVTKVDWAQVEPVDVITGGSPCQDLSHAGKRAGMRSGTRSGLWASMCDAIDIIQPRLVVWENVRGSLSAEADSALEPCPGCVGGGDDGPVLRALGRVLGDLAELGFDACWCGLRAADVGACHGRFRVFVVATPGDATGDPWWVRDRDDGAPADARGLRWGGRASVGGKGRPSDLGLETGRHVGDRSSTRPDLSLLPTPTSRDHKGRNQRDDASCLTGALLPTPTVSDYKASGSRGYGGNEFSTLTDATVRNPQDWSVYEAAIRRHETMLRRPAPSPAEVGPKGGRRLSPRFVEWMMGLPAGWVTDVPGLSRNEQLKALGNGVVVQQCAAALRFLLSREDDHAQAV